MYCKNCGKEVNPLAVICTGCGCAISNVSIVSIVLAYLLALGFPLLGIIAAIYLLFQRQASHAFLVGALAITAWIVWIEVLL